MNNNREQKDDRNIDLDELAIPLDVRLDIAETRVAMAEHRYRVSVDRGSRAWGDNRKHKEGTRVY